MPATNGGTITNATHAPSIVTAPVAGSCAITWNAQWNPMQLHTSRLTIRIIPSTTPIPKKRPTLSPKTCHPSPATHSAVPHTVKRAACTATAATGAIAVVRLRKM